MTRITNVTHIRNPLFVMLAAIAAAVTLSAQQKPQEPGFSFRTGVELINITATVTDGVVVGGLEERGLVRTVLLEHSRVAPPPPQLGVCVPRFGLPWMMRRVEGDIEKPRSGIVGFEVT